MPRETKKPQLFGVVVLTRGESTTDVSVYGPTTSRKTADAAEKVFTRDGAPAQIVELKELPRLSELRGAVTDDDG